MRGPTDCMTYFKVPVTIYTLTIFCHLEMFTKNITAFSKCSQISCRKKVVEFYFTMIATANIEGLKNNAPIKAWLPQATYPIF